MSFKLMLRSAYDKLDSPVSERSFNKDIVSIGRRDFNDLQLQDQRRLISSRHAEIRKKGNNFMVVDVGSKNGTQLNGQRIDVGKEYPLKQGDQINIGDFLIEFMPIISILPEGEKVQKGLDSTTITSDVTEEVQELIAKLKYIYADHLNETNEERKTLMLEIIRKAIEGKDEEDSRRIIDLIKSQFPEKEYQQGRVLQSQSEQIMECKTQEYELYKTAYHELINIAERYLANLEDLRSPESVKQLIKRIDMALNTMIECLANAIKGRKQFEEEFDVEATRIFSWKPNPIKLVEDSRGIGEYLIDWRRKESMEQVSSNLADAFTDLALHQMGLMAGFKECLRGILKQLDPESLEAEGQASTVNLGILKIHPQFGPLTSLAAWNRFKEKHKKLSEEEVKTFETILGPSFAKGYLSVQEKKKKAS